MRIQVFTSLATAIVLSLALAPAPASAKTAKECKKEWQADKAAMQAAGKTEKAYVAGCKTAANPATPATPPAKESSGGGGRY
jgi:hypothetical protein